MTTKYTIHKLDCHSCAMVMEGICEDTPGVKKAEVQSRQRILIVEHGEEVQPLALKEALEKEGYPVDLLS